MRFCEEFNKDELIFESFKILKEYDQYFIRINSEDIDMEIKIENSNFLDKLKKVIDLAYN